LVSITTPSPYFKFKENGKLRNLERARCHPQKAGRLVSAAHWADKSQRSEAL